MWGTPTNASLCQVFMSQLIKRLLVTCGWTKAVDGQAVGCSMQFREMSCGCKALVIGSGKRLWIVGLTQTTYGSCYERRLN